MVPKVAEASPRSASHAISDSLSAVSESVTGLAVIRAHGAEAEALERVDGALDRQFRTGFKTARFGAFLFSSAEIFAGLITAAVIGFGVVFGANGQLTTRNAGWRSCFS